MTDIANNYIFVFILGLISIVVPMLIMRHRTSQAYVMLAGFLTLGAIANCLPVFIEFFPSLTRYSLAIVVPSYIVQPICLWFYVKALCSHQPWKIMSISKWHCVLPCMAIIYAIAVLSVSDGTLNEMFSNQDDALTAPAEILSLVTFSFMLVWLGQSYVYMVFIFKRLFVYRLALKQLFASTDKIELGWLVSILLAIAITWILAFLALLIGFVSETGSDFVEWLPLSYLVLVWLFSFWGLRQKPGLNTKDITQNEVELVLSEVHHDSSDHKYIKSGLDEIKSQNIAVKIEKVMEEKKLFLLSELNLGVLASEIGEKPNYVSQALNQILQKSFFDYVNSLRIEFAKGLILQSEMTILDVALESGFNTKSSFYKAFKKETGLTPKQLSADSK